MYDLQIVIVSYNVRDLLHDCLLSVVESRLPGQSLAVTVVDNASGDGSADMVESTFPQVALIRGENRGYSHANNLGLRQTQARYHLLLNPDTLLPPSALAQVLAYMDEHSDVGAIGPRLVLADGSLDLACRRGFPTPLNSLAKYSGLARLFPHSRRLASYNLIYLDPDEEADVDSLVGAFMLLRGQALQEVGGLDEAFFMYGEDLDLCYRLKALGWRVLYWPEVTVLHYKKASSSQSQRAPREFFRAMRLFYDKHQAARALPGERCLVTVGIGAVERFVGYGRSA
ncbi:MAG: glycosyltransferase family 2 protein [Anaerolineae bacterium]